MNTSLAKHKVCLKCDHVAIGVESSPTAACPKCGAIYTKMEAKLGSKASIPVYEANASSNTSENRSTSPFITIGITAALSLGIGYFWGASNPSYSELTEEAHNAGVLFQAGFDPLSNFTLIKPSELLEYESKLPVTVNLTSMNSLDDRDSAYLRHSDFISELSIYNRSGRVITGITGLISFYDNMNNRIYSTKLTIHEPIMPQTSMDKWPFKFSIPTQPGQGPEFINTREIISVFQPVSVVYEDGELQEFYQ